MENRSIRSLEQRADQLIETERLQKRDLETAEAELAQLVKGVALDDAALASARRLVDLKRRQMAARPAELPLDERNALHELSLSVPSQALRAVRIEGGLSAKRKILAETRRALAEAQAAITTAAAAHDVLAAHRVLRPELIDLAKQALHYARLADGCAAQLGAALNALHRCEAPLARAIGTDRAHRVLSLPVMRARVHHGLAVHFEAYPDKAGARGNTVTLTIPGANEAPAERASLERQSDDIYADLIAGAPLNENDAA